MSVTITPGPYTPYQGYAIPGMKADSMFDNVDTWSANANINFGVVVSALTGIKVAAGNGANTMKGIALHDHLVGARGGYVQNDAVSVLTRGRAWARVSNTNQGTIADGNLVYVNAQGQVQGSATGGNILPNARFRGPMVALASAADVVWGGSAGTVNCAVVELHDPMHVPPAGT